MPGIDEMILQKISNRYQFHWTSIFLLEMVKLLLWFLLKFITVYCIQVVRSNFSWKCATVIYYCSVVHKNYNYRINHPYATENES